MSSMKTIATLATALCACVVADATQAEVLYHENWTNTSGSTIADPGTAGWTGLADIDNTGPLDVIGGDSRLQIATSNTGISSPSVNSDPQFADSTTGHLFSGATADPYLIWTEEFTIDGSVYDISTLEFSVGTNHKTGEPVRIAMRIGSVWYVSETVATTFSGWAASQTSGLISASTGDAGQDWFALTVDVANNVLSVGASAAVLPTTGDVTGFGMFSETKTDSHRFDNYHIEGELVPEPGSMSLIALGGALMLRRLRK